jgi:enoyl-CoA hydratase/carnithine racemase
VVGAPRAKQMALTGEAIDARTALQWGLVNEVVDGDAVRLAARVRELADAVAAGPRIAVQVSKQLIDGESSGAPPALMEALATGFISGTDDLREGVEAFRGKRKPRFGGQ